MILHQLYEWAQSSIHNLNFDCDKMNAKKKNVFIELICNS
jgi:hypothetical protein